MKRQHKPNKAKHVSTDAAMQPASSLEKQQQQQLMPNDVDADAPLLVLHVIRILALYLYVLLSRSHSEFQVDLDEVFFPQAKTIEMLMESTIQKLEKQLHSAIIACVQGEIASNQFDGLIQEKTVFAAINRVFRMQKIKAKLQCQLLARLLNRYLAQLSSTPIVHCDTVSTLASTLEYLSNESKNANVSHSLLYPLVNAVDSLSIEQRECLDSLTTLLRWLSACDPTERLLQRIVAMHHSVIFCIESVLPSTADTLGACFVRTLVHHADHVFRHDLGFTDPQDLFSSDSETEGDDEATATSSTTEPPSTPPSTARPQPPTFSPSTRAKAPSKKSNQKNSTNNRKLRAASPQKTHSPKATTRLHTKEIDDALLVLDANEPVPASMMRVGTLAAAAGTLAAALCVIFT